MLKLLFYHSSYINLIIAKVLLIKDFYPKQLLRFIGSAVYVLFGTSVATATDNKQPPEKEQKQKPTFSSELDESIWLQRELPALTACPKPVVSKFINPFVTRFEPEDLGYRFSADQTHGVVSETATVSGNVELESQQMRLRAGEMKLNLDNGEYSATNKILIETHQSIATADQVSGNADQSTAVLNQAKFRIKQSGGNGTAEQFRIDNDGQLSIDQLTFSTCPDTRKDWHFSASSLELDTKEGWGVASHMVMKAGDVPIFYFPWLKFPIDDRRHSGILAPSISASNRNGFDYQQPFYWNIAPDYDATISPRYIKKRGSQLGVEFRYLTKSSQGQSHVEYLSDRTVDLPGNNRWHYNLQHQTHLSNHWRFDLNAAGVSDINYFNDVGGNINAGELNSNSQDQLTRQGQLGYFSNKLQTYVRWLRFQPLALPSEPYRQLPQWGLNWQITDIDNPLHWTLTSQVTRFANDDPTQIEADRAVISSRVSYSLENSWGFVKPALKWHFADYEQNLNDQVSNEQISVASYSIDSGLIFERATDTGRQTLEPRLYLLYTPFEDQSQVSLFDTFAPDLTLGRLFSDNRFAGFDRIGDAKQLSIGLSSRWFSNQTPNHTWSWSLGRAYYQDPQQVTLNNSMIPSARSSSNLISEVSWQPYQSLRFNSELSYNTRQKNTERGSFSVMFEPLDNSIVNISHRFRDTAQGRSEQSDLAFAFPINEKWRVTGRWNHDLQNRQGLDTFAGVEYESCCWAIRLLNRRYFNARLDENGFIIPDQPDRYNDGWYLQFVFKGLGSVGKNSTSRLLEESIAGYQDPFLNQ